jgi:hypothetical protein
MLRLGIFEEYLLLYTSRNFKEKCQQTSFCSPDLRQLLASNDFTKRFSRNHVTIATLPTSRISGSPEGLRCGVNIRMLVIPQDLQDVRTFLSQVRSQLTPRGRVLLESLAIARLHTKHLTFHDCQHHNSNK